MANVLVTGRIFRADPDSEIGQPQLLQNRLDDFYDANKLVLKLIRGDE